MMTRTALWVTLMPAVVLWLSGCSSGPATAPLAVAKGNRAEISVTERGFEPAQVLVTHGRPVTLVVTRMTEMTCVTEMVMGSRHPPDAPAAPAGRDHVSVRFGGHDAVQLRHGDDEWCRHGAVMEG